MKKIQIFLILIFLVFISSCVSGNYENTVIERDGTGVFQNVFICNGVKRTYTLYVPRVFSEPVPLVIVLHGLGGSGKGIMKLTGFNDIADKENFIVVYPDGLDRSWKCNGIVDGGNDLEFLGLLIDYLGDNLNINDECVYATGFSNGGMMCYTIASLLSDKVFAVAPVGASMLSYQMENFSPTEPVPILMMNGTKDPIIPWNGGEVIVNSGKTVVYFTSTAETVDFWVENNKCLPEPEMEWLDDLDPDDGTEVKREVYSGGEDSRVVILYTIDGGGHNWPGTFQFRDEDRKGKTCKDIDGTRVIWEFFNYLCPPL